MLVTGCACECVCGCACELVIVDSCVRVAENICTLQLCLHVHISWFLGMYFIVFMIYSNCQGWLATSLSTINVGICCSV